ncbi:MAG: ferritin family protein [Deltaproteobacteria bacterium]|nr:ferritin family protein [Deltaproteobacteria bacterium]
MSTPEAAVLALSEAVKFESDGRDFYLQAVERVSNPLAKAVFQALAEDELDHIRRVREIYEELKSQAGWPDSTAMVARASGVEDAFARAARDLDRHVAPDADALEALEKAAELERKGLGFYRDRLAQATCDAEAEFYRRLVAEEEVHLRTIEKALEDLR